MSPAYARLCRMRCPPWPAHSREKPASSHGRLKFRETRTLRWREIDSNFPYAGAMNLVFAPFVSLDDRQLSKDHDGVARAVCSGIYIPGNLAPLATRLTELHRSCETEPPLDMLMTLQGVYEKSLGTAVAEP